MDAPVRALAERWGFEPEIELPPGYCSRVYADATRILKAPFQGEEVTTGLVAARRIADDIGPHIHAWDEATGTVLMDRILPGTKLHEAGLSDEECVQIATSFMHRLRHYPTDSLMKLADYVPARDPLANELLSEPCEEVFLHGDLHHENILLGPHGWVVIDPKGLVGDPAYEPAAFLHNPYLELPSWPDLPIILENRIRMFAQELDLNPWRVWAWSVVLARDGEPGSEWDQVAKALESLNWPKS